MLLYLKAGVGDLLLITEPALPTWCAWQLHSINWAALLSPLLSVFLPLSFSHLQACATRTHSHSRRYTHTDGESSLTGWPPLPEMPHTYSANRSWMCHDPCRVVFFLPDVPCRVWAKCLQAVRPSETTEMQWMRKTISLLCKKLPIINSTRFQYYYKQISICWAYFMLVLHLRVNFWIEWFILGMVKSFFYVQHCGL